MRWLARQADREAALIRLATGGDDYEIVCTAPRAGVEPLQAAAAALGFSFTEIGRVMAGQGVHASIDGRPVDIPRPGYRHG